MDSPKSPAANPEAPITKTMDPVQDKHIFGLEATLVLTARVLLPRYHLDHVTSCIDREVTLSCLEKDAHNGARLPLYMNILDL